MFTLGLGIIFILGDNPFAICYTVPEKKIAAGFFASSIPIRPTPVANASPFY